MSGLFALIARHGAQAMVGGVVLGLLIPPLAEVLFPLIGPLILVILSGSLLRLDWSVLASYGRRPRSPALAVLWLLVVFPLLGAGVAEVLPLPPGLSVALLLNAVTPPLMGSAAMALLLGLDAELAAVATVVVTLAYPVTLTALLASGMLAVPVQFATMAARIGWLLGVPVAVGLAGQWWPGRAALARHKAGFDALMVSALAVIAVALMHGANTMLRADPGAAMIILAAALVFNLTGQSVSALLFRRLGLGGSLAMAIMGGNRNLGLTLALTSGFLGTDFAAYVAFAQLPIYLTPLMLKAVKARLTAER